ncbi:hypothetical protein DAETH_25510 [Deinococcus aetherius]|uniref:Major facilitator superfamily (MFS) profile domain-containing protein n=1 Tax=Deinococcus aetherius TaxID=200252 RepID=A0ABM8AFK4_9DEIO|nr:MFS transporter [Deinococcus aetherius]BDP42582.1 hypothetical protein DAETH_25510 [Deinococcus aetherius]
MSASRRELPIHTVGAVALAVQGVYISSFGPLYPQLLHRFDLSQAEVGLITSANFLGSTTAVLSATWLIGRFGTRRLLTVAPVLVAVGALGIGLAPSWVLALLFALIGGLGAGATLVAIVAAGLATVPDLRVAAYVLLGFVLGPIFPTTVAWYGQPLTPRRLPIAMMGGSLGALAVQPLMGVAVSGFGVGPFLSRW